MRVLVAAPLLLVAVACAPRAGVVRPTHPLLRAELGPAPPSEQNPEAPPPAVAESPPPVDDGEAKDARDRIVKAAADVVGDSDIVVDGRHYRRDCSGTVRGIYARAGIKLHTPLLPAGESDSKALYELARTTGSVRRTDPLPGDLVFFDNSYDRNKNGKWDDFFSHVGVVERVLPDETVVFVHRIGSRIVRYRMNLRRPHDRVDEHGERINHELRAGDPGATAAELFVAFGSVPLHGAVVASR